MAPVGAARSTLGFVTNHLDTIQGAPIHTHSDFEISPATTERRQELVRAGWSFQSPSIVSGSPRRQLWTCKADPPGGGKSVGGRGPDVESALAQVCEAAEGISKAEAAAGA